MRAKSEIMNTLSARLNDDIWKKLKNSLLGRELLAFGAEVISENENVKDTMLLQLNPDTADKNGLFMLAQMNEVAITSTKPSCIVVKMLDGVRSFAPYELNYSVGNVAFTNIEYTMEGKTVSLINGTHKCYSKGVAVNDSSIVMSGEEAYFYDGGNNYTGIKLGNAYPDSITVCDADGIEFQRYSSDVALSNSIGVMYKVVTSVDGSIYLRFVCNEGYNVPSVFRIDWLEHACKDFDIDSNAVVKVENTDVALIKYTTLGGADDVEFMRQQLKKEMAKYNGLNTPASIERYVRGLPYVLDAKCERSESGINVYVKPSSYLDLHSYLDFSEIAAHISLNSILFPNIKIKTGNQIKFGIEISGVEDVKMQNSIKQLLQSKFAYSNMSYNSIVNTGNVLAEIYDKYRIVPTISITLQEPFVQNKPLAFKPIKNTIKLYDNYGSIVAWEENDLLYGKGRDSVQVPFSLYRIVATMGTMFLLMYEGTETERRVTTRNFYNIAGGGDIDTYNSDIDYEIKGINKFYLYDVSTDTIKPYDGSIQNLLLEDTESCLKHGAWNSDEQSLGNIYDAFVSSTNDSLVISFVFKNSGTLITTSSGSGGTPVGTPVYWRTGEDDTDLYNSDLYNKYVSTDMADSEPNMSYKGKYKTTLFIKNPIALKNINSENWNLFTKAVHGDTDEMVGLNEGLRNIDVNGRQLNIKSNWFVYNNKAYYAYKISDKYVYITNGAKNMTVGLNGSFLGMIPFENNLYIINENFISKINNFEGLKEKEEIYQIYKDFNTPMYIEEIFREFDGQIFIKSGGSYYMASGFEIISGNKMGFKDLKQLFGDIDVADCEMGGCTQDFATLYKKTDNGFDFYCYNINTAKTFIYNKFSDIKTEVNTQTITQTEYVPAGSGQYTPVSKSTIIHYRYNLADFFPQGSSLDFLQKKKAITHNAVCDQVKLYYYNANNIPTALSESRFKDIVLVRINRDNHWYFALFLKDAFTTTVNSEEVLCTVPLYTFKYSNGVADTKAWDNSDGDNYAVVQTNRADWKQDNSSGYFDASTPAGVYKISYQRFVNEILTNNSYKSAKVPYLDALKNSAFTQKNYVVGFGAKNPANANLKFFGMQPYTMAYNNEAKPDGYYYTPKMTLSLFTPPDGTTDEVTYFYNRELEERSFYRTTVPKKVMTTMGENVASGDGYLNNEYAFKVDGYSYMIVKTYTDDYVNSNRRIFFNKGISNSHNDFDYRSGADFYKNFTVKATKDSGGNVVDDSFVIDNGSSKLRFVGGNGDEWLIECFMPYLEVNVKCDLVEVKGSKVPDKTVSIQVPVTTTSSFIKSASAIEKIETIGYFDTKNNACVNDKGSEVAYIKYHTQNFNVSNDSYLVLDNNEIKFV